MTTSIDANGITFADGRLQARAAFPVPVRQTVLSGPVDTNGLPSFGGSTGSTTVTATGTLRPTASNGFDASGPVDYVGSITNPSWTSLSTNGTMYLYLDIAAAGTCTTGSTTLLPTYRWGGADVTTNNQATFNIQEMQMKVGNGSVATQTYRVFLGEVTVSGSVVTAITWYALMGRYDSGWTATIPAAGTAVSRNHNIGCTEISGGWQIECTTTDAGYAVGDRLIVSPSGTGSTLLTSPSVWSTRNSIGVTIANGNSVFVANKSTGVQVALTVGSWKYKLVAQKVF